MASELGIYGAVRPEWLGIVEGLQRRTWSDDAGRTDQEEFSCQDVEFRYHLGGP